VLASGDGKPINVIAGEFHLSAQRLWSSRFFHTRSIVSAMRLIDRIEQPLHVRTAFC
jgi:hypothetical protein